MALQADRWATDSAFGARLSLPKGMLLWPFLPIFLTHCELDLGPIAIVVVVQPAGRQPHSG